METTSDPRLRAGVRAALEHICERHGLNKEEQHEFVASVENECASGAKNSGDASCTVIIDEMEDRVEVAVAVRENLSGKINSRETNSAKYQSASHGKENGGAGRVFVKHFQKNAAHS